MRRALRYGIATLLLAVLAACSGSDHAAPKQVAVARPQALRLATGWVTGSSWPSETVVALSSAYVADAAAISGNVAVMTSNAGPYLSGTQECVLGQAVELRGNVRADSLRVGDGARVFGTAGYNDLSINGAIDGVRTTPITMPLTITVVTSADFTAGTTNVTVNAGATQTLAAGNYGAVVLNAGTATSRAVLRLSSGTYNISSIDQGNWSRIECSAACVVKVKNRLKTGTRAYFGPSSASALQISAVTLFVEGDNGGTAGPTSTPFTVDVGADSELKAFTFVPNGTLNLQSRSRSVGKFVGRWVQIGDRSEVLEGTGIVTLPDPYITGIRWPESAITAYDSVNLVAPSTLNGDVSVLTAATGATLLTGYELALGIGSRVNGSATADSVNLSLTSVITGSLSYNNGLRLGTVQGSQITPITVPLALSVPAFPAFSAGTTTVDLGIGGRQNLAAGSYAMVRVRGNAILTLTGGTYNVADIDLQSTSRIECAAACEIRVKNRIAGAGSTFLGPSASSGLDFSNVRIFVEGKDGVLLGIPYAAAFGDPGVLRGFIFVPNGTLQFGLLSTPQGRFVARDVLVATTATVSKGGTTVIAPAIVTQPSPVTVPAGQPATFNVVATGTDIRYQWQRNNVDIAGAISGSYTINPAQLSNDGEMYRVVITNAAGSVTSTSVRLTVTQAPPTITTQPSPVSVQDGQNATFSVVATGTSLSYQWQKNGTNISGATASSYTAVAVHLVNDGEMYRVVVTNVGGSVTSNAVRLTVTPVPPAITTQPSPVSVLDGQNATFSVVATGTSVGYQWQKNGTNITGATASSYTAVAVHLVNDGEMYRVVVSNGAGSVTSNAVRLTVTPVPPAITTQPSPVSVLDGQNATFSVVATGTSVGYQWQKNGTNITGATASSYTAVAVHLVNDGEMYRVVVSNGAGSVTSTAVRLTVTPVPPAITTQPSAVSVLDGQNATFSVVATGTSVGYQWQLNGTNITGATASSYTVVAARLVNDGELYRVVVSNGAGSVTSTAVRLTVTPVPPAITTQPSAVSVLDGADATFSVTATGTSVAYQWQRNSANVPGATASSYTATAVHVANDGDLYRVVVSNGAGSVTSTAVRLTVTPVPPAITVEPTDVSVLAGQLVSLTCAASGTSPSYRWQKNGSDIPSATSPTFTIASAQASSAGGYRCVASNAAGTATSRTATVTILNSDQPPVIDVQPDDVAAPVGQAATFSLTAGGASLSYQWQRVGANGTGTNIAGATSASYTLAAVTLTNDGALFRCIVTNPYGTAQSATARLTVVDSRPVTLSVDGETERRTSADRTVITGQATAGGAGVSAVEITSDRYPALPFSGVPDAEGRFSIEVPLLLGNNALTVRARDAAGQSSEQSVLVIMELPSAPIVRITAPLNGSIVNEPLIVVSGTVVSSLPREQIRLELAGQTAFPTGSAGQLTFSFPDVHLAAGINLLTVAAITPFGRTQTETIVQLGAGPGDQGSPPRIRVFGAQSNLFTAKSPLPVSGAVEADTCISAVTVNGTPASKITGKGTSITFEASVPLSAGAAREILVRAQDCSGRSSTLTYDVTLDATPPVLTLLALQPDPTVNAISSTPYRLRGRVTEANLAGLSLDDQSLSALPDGASDWVFVADVPLVRGQQRTLVVDSWDLAGTHTSKLIQLRLDATLDIEIVTPSEGATLAVRGTTPSVDVVARIPGMSPTDNVTARVDSGATVSLARSGDNATGALAVSAGQHELTVEVRSGATLLASRSRAFSVVNNDLVPLAIVAQQPANGERGVEANAFVSFGFNRAIDPTLLDVKLFETAHGLTYPPRSEGADLRAMSKIELIAVNHDREGILGGVSVVPEGTLAAFYPRHDYAFGGTIFVEVNYEGHELARTSFEVRPLPTFVQGVLTNQFDSPLPGITASIPALGLTTTTDEHGIYGFGFGTPATDTIPSGRYRAVFNPGLADRRYGSSERFISVEQGRLNSAGPTLIAELNPKEPFRHAASGDAAVSLAGGSLELNLSAAQLVFPDGLPAGAVHAQFQTAHDSAVEIGNRFMPPWLYALQPVGIEVTGKPRIAMALPTRSGNHDYVADLADYVLLVGRARQSLIIEPVGVARIDHDQHRVESVGDVALQRLDFIGYAEVKPEQVPLLQQTAAGQLALSELINALGATE